jgi:hypothetical protein
MEKKRGGFKCPRCKKPGSNPVAKWVLNEEKRRYEPYYYVGHSRVEGGKKKIHWCYLGKDPKRLRGRGRERKGSRSP